MTTTYALISCGKDKAANAVPAQDLYLGDLFKKCRAYVEMQGRPFFILSALHGLLAPDRVTEPYDKTLNGATPAENEAWAWRVLGKTLAAIPVAGSVIEIYAGREYRKNLVKLLEAAGYEIVLPLEGVGGIGSQKAWLKAKLVEGAAATAAQDPLEEAHLAAIVEDAARRVGPPMEPYDLPDYHEACSGRGCPACGGSGRTPDKAQDETGCPLCPICGAQATARMAAAWYWCESCRKEVNTAQPAPDVQEPQGAIVARYVASKYNEKPRAWAVWDTQAKHWAEGGKVHGSEKDAEKEVTFRNEVEAANNGIFTPQLALADGDQVEYRFTNVENDTWQPATYYHEAPLYWLLVDTDGELRDYFKDRVEVRRL